MARPTARDVHVDSIMTGISIGYHNNAYIAQEIFPIVPVEHQTDLYYTFDKESWYRNRSGPRAPGTVAPRADYGIATASYLCVNDAMAKEIPDEVRDNSDAPLRVDITATNFVTDALELALEIRVATLITACANWAAASNPGTGWSVNNSDPWADIDTAVDAVVSTTGREPNVAVLGWPVWKSLRNHPDFLDRVKYTRSSGRIEVGDLRSWFGFDKVLIGRAIKNNAMEGQAASLAYVWGNTFWVGYVPAAPALEEPSSGYIFRWGNRKVERFRDDQAHMDIIAAEWNLCEKITASDTGAGFFSIT